MTNFPMDKFYINLNFTVAGTNNNVCKQINNIFINNFKHIILHNFFPHPFSIYIHILFMGAEVADVSE